MSTDTLVAPAHLWVPEHVSDAADMAVDLMASVGRTIDPEQRLALQAIYAERADGRWAALESATVCCRQNLKSYTLEAAALTDVILMGDQLVMWTAHRFATTLEAFRNLLTLVEGFDHLRKRVLKVNNTNGEEGIEFRSGARLLFRARSANAGRGLSGDKVILDEAFALTPGMIGSLMPTLSARPNPQIRYASSAGMADSVVLRRLRDRGRKGGDPFLAWAEWCAPGSWEEPGCTLDPCSHEPGTPGCVLDDPRLWAAANPALGKRIREEFVAGERRSMTPQEFGRERLGWWDDPVDSVETAISRETWAKRQDSASYATDPIAFAIDVPPRAGSAAISVVGWRPASLDVDTETGEVRRRKHVETAITGPGTGWVVKWLAERIVAWDPIAVAVDGSSPAAALLPDLRAKLRELDTEAGRTVDREDLIVVLGARDTAAACGMLDADVREDGLRHPGQAELAVAVEGATWRPLAGGRAFARSASDVDISPLMAAAIAGWALVTQAAPAKAPPAKPQAVPVEAQPGLDGGRAGSLDGLGGAFDPMSVEF